MKHTVRFILTNTEVVVSVFDFPEDADSDEIIEAALAELVSEFGDDRVPTWLSKTADDIRIEWGMA